MELKGGVQASVAVRKLWCSNGMVEGARCVIRAMMRGPGIGSRAEVVVLKRCGGRSEVGVESLVVESCEA